MFKRVASEDLAASSRHAKIVLLRDEIRAQLNQYVDPFKNFALLDFPNHANVGDSAIWIGELAYFKSTYNMRPSFVCSINNFNQNSLRDAVPEGPIFLHGGGNFGDIWPEYQNFREFIITTFPERQIVQLPQTIHFKDKSSILRTASIIERHKNFILFARDKNSYEIARSNFSCKVHLAPDMAFCLGEKTPPFPPAHPLLLLLRTDKEGNGTRKAPSHNLLQDGSIQEDWLNEDPAIYSKQRKYTALTSFLDLGTNAFVKHKQRELLFENLASHRVRRGINLLSSAAFVISDRLHVHILCFLLGIPHILLDNNYGKLSSFIDTWNDRQVIQIAPSIEVAIELWRKEINLT